MRDFRAEPGVKHSHIISACSLQQCTSTMSCKNYYPKFALMAQFLLLLDITLAPSLE